MKNIKKKSTKKKSVSKKSIKKASIKKKSVSKKSIKKASIKKKSVSKKSIKKASIKKKTVSKKSIKKASIKKKSVSKKSIKKASIKKKTVPKIIVKKRVSLISKVIKLQHSLKPEFNIKINFSLEKHIQAFFDFFANKIVEYKVLKADEKRKRKLEQIEKREKEKILIYKKKIIEEELQTKLKEKNLKDEIKLEKERARDIKLFLRKEQALVRIEQAERQKQFLKQLKLEKQIENLE